MISHLSIENFKSIRKVNLDCRKMNIFLGEPDTGKSNILEALGLLSWCGQTYYGYDHEPVQTGQNHAIKHHIGETHELPHMQELSSYIRFEKIQNIFFKNQIQDPVIISILKGDHENDNSPVKTLMITIGGDDCRIQFRKGKMIPENKEQTGWTNIANLHITGQRKGIVHTCDDFQNIFFYRYKDLVQFPDPTPLPLKSPFGQNLFSVVMYDKRCQSIMKELFSSSEFKFVLKPADNKFEFQQEEDNIVFTYPYQISSDTYRHIAFFAIAVASQTNATLIFEEPEAHTFPYYTKYLAEQIWLDKTNQYFIVTHNQYLLSTLIEKVRKEDLALFIVTKECGETCITPMDAEKISDMICNDPFFDLERFLGN